MRAGRAASGMLLAAGIFVAAVLCSVGATQEAGTGTANADAWTLTVESSPISGVVISGTHPGASNYGISDEDTAAVSLTAPDSWMDGSTLYEFVRWTVNGSAQPAGQATVEFSLSRDTTAAAGYERLAGITVTSPNGGEQCRRGVAGNIEWSWTGDPGPNVKIALYKGGVWKQMITSSTPNDGLFSVTLPCSVAPGADYKVKITSLTYPSLYDFSDADFRITSFLVTAPAGGPIWKRGTTHSITWTSWCNPGPNVKLALYKGGSWVSMITSSTPNDGSYSWPIPASTTAGSDYKVRVTSLANTADWRASNTFTITE